MRLDNIKTDKAFDYGYLLKRIYPYIKPLMFRIFITFILAIPLGLLDGATAFVLKPYIDVVVNGQTFVSKILVRDSLPPNLVLKEGDTVEIRSGLSVKLQAK